jgi:hypothetical protein
MARTLRRNALADGSVVVFHSGTIPRYSKDGALAVKESVHFGRNWLQQCLAGAT